MAFRAVLVFAALSTGAKALTSTHNAGSRNQHKVFYSSSFWPFTSAHSNTKPITEADYQQAAAKTSDEAMIEFVVNLLEQDNKIVLNNGELAGFVKWYSGTKSVQSLERMKEELASKDWVQTAPKALSLAAQASGHNHALVSEGDYQEVAALKSDEAMMALVVRMLDSENKTVGNFGELAGLVQWFSGTKAVQTLAKLRQELSAKDWVQPLKVAKKASAQRVKVAEKPKAAISHEARVAEHHKERKHLCYRCVISDDSNVMSYNFNKKRNGTQTLLATSKSSLGVRVSEPGTYWLWHTGDVQIQARFWKANATALVLGALAVSGEFMQGNTLTVRPKHRKLQWNEDEILVNQSHFTNYYMHGRFEQHPKDVISGQKIDAGMQFHFVNNMSIVVNRFAKSIAVSIQMCGAEEPEKLEGHCATGFIDGKHKLTDEMSLVRSKKLSQHDSIFIDVP